MAHDVNKLFDFFLSHTLGQGCLEYLLHPKMQKQTTTTTKKKCEREISVSANKNSDTCTILFADQWRPHTSGGYIQSVRSIMCLLRHEFQTFYKGTLTECPQMHRPISQA